MEYAIREEIVRIRKLAPKSRTPQEQALLELWRGIPLDYRVMALQPGHVALLVKSGLFDPPTISEGIKEEHERLATEYRETAEKTEPVTLFGEPIKVAAPLPPLPPTMREIIESRKPRTIAQLAQEAIDIQGACNPLGITKRFAEATQELHELLGGMTAVRRHPVWKTWVYKLYDMSGCDNESFCTAYLECEKLAKDDEPVVIPGDED